MVAVRFRRHHHQRRIVGTRHLQRPHRARHVLVKDARLLDRGAIGQGIEQPPLRRGIDHAMRGPPVLDISDVDGEIAPALDELLGAVQGVDDQKGRGRLGVAVGLFLGDQGHRGKGRAQAGRDHGVRRLVRRRHGAAVALGADREIGGVVDRHDPVARRQRQAAHFRDQ